MEPDGSTKKTDWELELSRVLASRLPGLWHEVFAPTKKSVLVDASLSVKRWRGAWLAVLRGDRVDGGGGVVCFGGGSTPLEALRAVSRAVSRGEYKPDKFAQYPSGGVRSKEDKPETLEHLF